MGNADIQENIDHHIQKQLQWRYATKFFDRSRLISPKDWDVLADSLRLAPSSLGLEPWHFVVAESPAFKEKLVEAAPYNKQKFETASHVVVLARLKSIKVEYIDSYIKHMADVRDVPLSSLQDFRNMIVAMTQGLSQEEQAQWAAKQTYLALGSLLTTAALMEIDACPMEGIDPAKCDEILGLSGTDYETVVVAALGYRSPDDTMQLAKKVRFPSKQVFTFV